MPDKISLGSNVEDILIKNFEYADTLDLSEYNVNELSAGKYQNTSPEIWSRKTHKTIAVLEDVTDGADENIICTDNDGFFVTVSLRLDFGKHAADYKSIRHLETFKRCKRPD